MHFIDRTAAVHYVLWLLFRIFRFTISLLRPSGSAVATIANKCDFIVHNSIWKGALLFCISSSQSAADRNGETNIFIEFSTMESFTPSSIFLRVRLADSERNGISDWSVTSGDPYMQIVRDYDLAVRVLRRTS